MPINLHSYGHDGNLFLQELKSVDLAIQQLEILVNESESNQASEREPFSAVRADLEKIWSLKKEVEYLEASLKSKASLLQKSLTVKPVMSKLCHGCRLDPIWEQDLTLGNFNYHHIKIMLSQFHVIRICYFIAHSLLLINPGFCGMVKFHLESKCFKMIQVSIAGARQQAKEQSIERGCGIGGT